MILAFVHLKMIAIPSILKIETSYPRTTGWQNAFFGFISVWMVRGSQASSSASREKRSYHLDDIGLSISEKIRL
jgi:hypothetical protein